MSDINETSEAVEMTQHPDASEVHGDQEPLIPIDNDSDWEEAGHEHSPTSRHSDTSGDLIDEYAGDGRDSSPPTELGDGSESCGDTAVTTLYQPTEGDEPSREDSGDGSAPVPYERPQSRAGFLDGEETSEFAESGYGQVKESKLPKSQVHARVKEVAEEIKADLQEVAVAKSDEPSSPDNVVKIEDGGPLHGAVYQEKKILRRTTSDLKDLEARDRIVTSRLRLMLADDTSDKLLPGLLEQLKSPKGGQPEVYRQQQSLLKQLGPKLRRYYQESEDRYKDYEAQLERAERYRGKIEELQTKNRDLEMKFREVDADNEFLEEDLEKARAATQEAFASGKKINAQFQEDLNNVKKIVEELKAERDALGANREKWMLEAEFYMKGSERMKGEFKTELAAYDDKVAAQSKAMHELEALTQFQTRRLAACAEMQAATEAQMKVLEMKLAAKKSPNYADAEVQTEVIWEAVGKASKYADASTGVDEGLERLLPWNLKLAEETIDAKNFELKTPTTLFAGGQAEKEQLRQDMEGLRGATKHDKSKSGFIPGATSQREKAVAALQKVEEANAELRQSVDSATAERDGALKRVQDLKQNTTESADTKVYEDQLAEKEKVIADLTSEKASDRKTLDWWRESRGAANSQIKRLEADLERLQKDHLAAQAYAKQAYHGSEASKAALQSQVNTLNTQNAAWQAKFTHAKNELTMCRQHTEVIKRENKQLKSATGNGANENKPQAERAASIGPAGAVPGTAGSVTVAAPETTGKSKKKKEKGKKAQTAAETPSDTADPAPSTSDRAAADAAEIAHLRGENETLRKSQKPPPQSVPAAAAADKVGRLTQELEEANRLIIQLNEHIERTHHARIASSKPETLAIPSPIKTNDPNNVRNFAPPSPGPKIDSNEDASIRPIDLVGGGPVTGKTATTAAIEPNCKDPDSSSHPGSANVGPPPADAAMPENVESRLDFSSIGRGDVKAFERAYDIWSRKWDAVHMRRTAWLAHNFGAGVVRVVGRGARVWGV